MRKEVLYKIIKLTVLIIIPLILVLIAIPYIDMVLTNGNLYGRMIETKHANHLGMPNKHSGKLPTLRLILHKILPEENGIEASLMVYGDKNLFNDKFHATLRTGYNNQPFAINYVVSSKDSMAFNEIGLSDRVFQSERFIIPIAHSVSGFPNDKILLRPIVNYYTDWATYDFNFEIQKAISGRNLSIEIEGGNNVTIELYRTRIEKVFVKICSGIFLLISVFVGFGIIVSKRGFSKLEELLMVAGYLLAIAGFRELIGLSRISGISALEIVVIGVPMILIFIALIISFIKGLHAKGNNSSCY
jgi:hypothetical protein